MEVARKMANMTGGTAVAERPADLVWLSTLPTAPKPALRDALPAVRVAAPLMRVARPAEGVLSGLPGAVTDLAVSHDGRHLVAAHYGQDAVSIIDVATLAVVATAAGIAEPYAVSIADRAYIRSASIAEDTVVAVDLASGAQLAAREIGTGAQGLAVSPDGDLLYVARVTDEVAEIAVIDVESGAVSTLPVAHAAGASIDTVRINRAGTRLYAALTTAAGGALLMIDVRNGQVQTVQVGESIGDIAVDRNDRRIFMTGWDPELGGVLRIVDTASARLVHTIAIGGLPVGLLVAGGAVYVADGEDVVVIDASTARVVHRTAIGRPVSCLAISLDGSHLYVGDYEGSVAALPMQSAGLGLLRAAS
jgi:DNA-binding beta-propeller fold protein YncE